MVIRKSKEDDVVCIRKLLTSVFSFDSRSVDTALANLDNRYLLAFNGLDELVAITGLSVSLVSHVPEIDWTCVRKDYRGKGIMNNLFHELFQECPYTKVYASVWHVHGLEKPNLGSLLERYGFKLLFPAHIRLGVQYDEVYSYHPCKSYKQCSMWNGTGQCYCCEDLYVRERSIDT